MQTGLCVGTHMCSYSYLGGGVECEVKPLRHLGFQIVYGPLEYSAGLWGEMCLRTFQGAEAIRPEF